jgi:hypothetical protein
MNLRIAVSSWNRERLQAIAELAPPGLAVGRVAGCDLVQRQPTQAQDAAG